MTLAAPSPLVWGGGAFLEQSVANEAKHTPGPWRSTGTGEVMAVPSGFICTCGDPDEHGNKTDEANAILIAAAPDLLAMCRRMLTAVNAMPNKKGGGDTLERQLEAVIAKAEGGGK